MSSDDLDERIAGVAVAGRAPATRPVPLRRVPGGLGRQGRGRGGHGRGAGPVAGSSTSTGSSPTVCSPPSSAGSPAVRGPVPDVLRSCTGVPRATCRSASRRGTTTSPLDSSPPPSMMQPRLASRRRGTDEGLESSRGRELNGHVSGRGSGRVGVNASTWPWLCSPSRATNPRTNGDDVVLTNCPFHALVDEQRDLARHESRPAARAGRRCRRRPPDRGSEPSEGDCCVRLDADRRTPKARR